MQRKSKNKMKLKISIFLFMTIFSASVFAQNSSHWKRKKRIAQELQLFHSTFSINLPTAETLQKGDFEFEISHRFVPPITEGAQVLYGLDGPVNMRIALGYALSNRIVATLGRSNVEDNVDFHLKAKALQIRNKAFPVLLSLQGGIARNAQPYRLLNDSSRKYQYYVQAVLNTLLYKKLGIGIVPAYLYNSHIYCVDTKYSFTMGNYVQYYVSPLWSVLAEWIPTVTGWRQWHNSMSFGIELETGGHFFKIFFTNNDKLNTSQYMSGADMNFGRGDWRLGFMITRLLKFGK